MKNSSPLITLAAMLYASLLFSCYSDLELPEPPEVKFSKNSSSSRGVVNPIPNSSSSGVASKNNGTFTDTRDSQLYNWVKIGGQTWMAANLNYNAAGSKCYDCTKYGRLYDHETAKTACLTGWHLPTKEEWKKIIDDPGSGKNLKTATWGGIDAYDFAALPGGYYDSDGKDFALTGQQGIWWTSSLETNAYPYAVYMRNYDDEAELNSDYKSNFLSVRCVQN